MNINFFNRLPADVQKVLLEEGSKGGAEQTRLTVSLNDDFMAKLKSAGVSFVDVDNAAFQRVTASVYKAFPKWTPGLHDTVMAALKK